jgi:hypothetical protein
MYFFSGEATCLKVMPDAAVMSVNEILFSRKGAKAQRKAQRRIRRAKLLCGFLCAFAPLREKSLFI